MFIVSSITSWFRSESVLNLPYQSTPLSSETKSSDIYSVHRFRIQPTRGDTRRRPSDHAATRRGCPGKASHDGHTHPRLPDLFVVQFFISSPPPQAATELSARHCCRASFAVAELANHRKNTNSVFTIAPPCPPLPSPPPSYAVRALVRSQ